MANSRYNRLDNQAPVQTALKADDVSVGRSAFDWSCIHNTNAIIGALIPIDCFDVVPNEDIDLSLSSLLEFRNPTTRQLFNGMRVFFHAYYNRLTDLWEGARNWLDNGRTGHISLTRPNLIYHCEGDNLSYQVGNVTFPAGSFVNTCTPMSLLNYLGLPSEAFPKTVGITSHDVPPLRFFQTSIHCEQGSSAACSADKLANSSDFFPADCVMAYQRNWRDYYSNKNLLQNNLFWFPDNEEHFILSYSCQEAFCIAYEMENGKDHSFSGVNYNHFVINAVGSTLSSTPLSSRQNLNNYNVSTPEPNNPDTTGNTHNDWVAAPNLCGLKFRQFRGDRFTTALPFPDLIRGDIPLLNATSEAVFSVDTIFDQYVKSNADDTELTGRYVVNQSPVSVDGTTVYYANTVRPNVDDANQVRLVGDIQVAMSGLGITMSDIYTLETLTAFRRRMGMTNGDYNEMIKSQYGVNPNVHDRKGTYIGGFYQDFAFSSVTQQSESGATPLGTKSGQGVSSGSGSIGHFHTPDFGWIQIYMSVVPDVYYTQGIPKMFSKKNNLEMYFPIFNNLPAQAILNKELYVFGDTSIDNDVFAYEDRYAEYKSRHNRVSGLMALPVDKAPFDTARIIARRFESTPALNSLFVSMVPENIDMSVFTVSDEPPFDVSVGISCRRVFPAPYTAIEGSLSSPSLVRG